MSEQDSSQSRATLIHPGAGEYSRIPPTPSRGLSLYHAVVNSLAILAALGLAAAAISGAVYWARSLPPSLARANLSGKALVGVRLDGANLQRANLSHADLSRAGLRGADLDHANLFGAELRGADLTGANLDHANLTRASFHDANLSSAKMTDVTVSHTRFDGADMAGAHYQPIIH